MKNKKSEEFRKKITEGLKESNQKMIERTKKNKGYLVVSYKDKIEVINYESIPEKISELEVKYK